MPAPESFESWLDGFRKEVDAVVSRAASQPGAELDAKVAFDQWWRTNQEPVKLEGPEPIAEIAARMDQLLAERAVLEKKLEEAGAEVDAARQAKAETAVARAETARERQRAELRAEQKDAELKALQDHISKLKDDRKFFEDALSALEAAKRRLDEDLRLERERGRESTAEVVKLQGKNAEQAKALAELEKALACREGTLEELRRQTSAYQERLVHAKELTDADVALLRQELRLYLEEMRIMVNTIKKGATK